eukprot:scaffold57383_cov35-Cyclotella_meneghiniana.AAC.2
MGFSPSPYNSIRMALIAEEVIRGDKADSMNPYQWNSVRLNLPGTSSYDPTTSWIAKVREDGLVACELFTFVDDERVTGATEELTWLAAHVMTAKQAYLGIQDAARKAGECSQQPRAWAGAVVHVVEDKGVCVLTSEEKWRKMKDILEYWYEVVTSGETSLDHKRLLSDRSFLLRCGGARGNRDADGWKLPPEKMTDKMEMDDGVFIERDEDEDEAAAAYFKRKKLNVPGPTLHAPVDGFTSPAPHLLADLKALIKLTSAALPPLRMVRLHHVAHVFYGTGKGSTKQSFKTLHHPSGELGPASEIKFKVGVWNASIENESSNYRELRNFVEDLELEASWVV